MSKQANGQRAQAIRMGSIRPAAADLVVGVKVKTPEEIAKSRAKAIAARRKEFTTA
jgi:hypothetical protein